MAKTLYEQYIGTSSATGWGNFTTTLLNETYTVGTSTTSTANYYNAIHYNTWENEQGTMLKIPKKILKTIWAMARINGQEVKRGMVQLKSVFQRVKTGKVTTFIFQFLDGNPIQFDVEDKDMVDLVDFYIPALSFVMQTDFKRLLGV